MRKRIDPAIPVKTALTQGDWLDLESTAEIEVTSEDRLHPIEAALLPGNGAGWRAGSAGRQILRIVFDAPVTVSLIHLVFTEDTVSRTQEFVVRWSKGNDLPFQEVVRQQYNFTPVSSEVEDYTVALSGVKRLEVEITPSISGGEFRASLSELRLR